MARDNKQTWMWVIGGVVVVIVAVVFFQRGQFLKGQVALPDSTSTPAGTICSNYDECVQSVQSRHKKCYEAAQIVFQECLSKVTAPDYDGPGDESVCAGQYLDQTLACINDRLCSDAGVDGCLGELKQCLKAKYPLPPFGG